jgi:hypothetical protein
VTRVVILADTEREVDDLPAGLVNRATVVVANDGRSWRVLKSPHRRALDASRYRSALAALEEALA